MNPNVFRAIRLATRAITASFEKGTDTTLPQYLVLEAIGEQGGMAQTQLSAITCIDRTTISSILRRLETDNLVKVAKNPDDLRISLMYLTTEGKRELRKHSRRAEKLTAKLCANEAAAAKLVADLTALADRAGS